MDASYYTMAADGNWDKVCRLCLQEKNEMLPIFGNEAVQRKVVQKLRACLPVLVYKTDPLPKQICQFCAARLDDAYGFRQHCLNVYKEMHAILLRYKQTESVQIYLDAMRNSSDPCQVQLCKSRAPPPLVPLSGALLFDDSISIDQANQDYQNICMEILPELPCEVEIKEVNTDPYLNVENTICESSNKKCKLSEMFDTDIQMKVDTVPMSNMEEARTKQEYVKEEKQTSILEQALTGNLIMNNHQQSRAKLTSEWWCSPCNNYYKTRDSLMKHMQLHCPRVYSCRTCLLTFESVEILAKHEADNHFKIRLEFTENDMKDCEQCDRQFVSWEMLRQHRLRDHQTLIENGSNTCCSLCNRSFPTEESYQKHILLHQTNATMSEKLSVLESTITKTMERSREIKGDEQYYENIKYPLVCPTCGKICTQQSALSNHMRTHEPKKFKCDICGRSFTLFIRLTAHRLAEHNKEPMMSPVLSAVEQEEALNAEREAREAREAKTRVKKAYSEMIEKNDIPIDDESSAKRAFGGFKNVARCAICLQWFNDHTTMLKHLQTHQTANYNSYVCQVCNKSFKEQSQLSKHEARHKRLTLDNASLYTLSAVCNKSFMDQTHQKTHTVDKTYLCAKCNKIFFKQVSLLAHQCTGGAVLGKKTAAKSRQRTPPQNGNKTYKCSKCDAAFASSQSRNAHMKMHAEYMRGNAAQTQEIKVDDEPMPELHPEVLLEYNGSPIEPKIEINEQSTPPPLKRTLVKTSNGYRCGVCRSPFVLRELAVAHLRSAHPVMPYQCPYCKKRFITQYSFTHHIKTEHPDEPEK
ncbi:hypothetical protein P5V15_000766 [Pogonomyrmex californicus]